MNDPERDAGSAEWDGGTDTVGAGGHGGTLGENQPHPSPIHTKMGQEM